MNEIVDRESINKKMASLLSLDGEGEVPTKRSGAKFEMSFIFFSDINQGLVHQYQLVFDVSAFADEHGFSAVWLPERHFHPFGGIYPNPSVLAAALAVKTKNIRLRSGSVVLPLHHPIEVVEAWSMVDHLSNGRVDLGFASGWNPNDFILSQDTYDTRRQVWFDRITEVEQLWRGERGRYLNGKGESREIEVFPKPIQQTLNIWLVVSKSDDSFIYAGSKGYNVLTMLQGIDLDKLGEKIKLYRDARQDNGFDPEGGTVTLMMHTLINEDVGKVKAAVREPFFDYIKSAMTGHIQAMPEAERPSEEGINRTVEYSYERYYKTGALFGSIEDAERVVSKAISVGVNEVACLMDFGLDYDTVMASLPYLYELKERVVISA
ncbi:MAG: LLM class flavin-dependent oxidoreductase [Gammaproteobacteria bacterium]|nr:LLM class flavin-dependent oxidoreductase [Gammaproteobacteria bacterium]